MEKCLSSPRVLGLLFVSVLLLLSLLYSAAAACGNLGKPQTLPDEEIKALRLIATSSNGSFSAPNTNYCSDLGIGAGCTCRCNQSFCHVDSIYFRGQQLSGMIPPALANFTELRSLDLSSNYLRGPIPSALGTLKSLQYLNLDSNFLTGSIPADLGALSSLRVMALSLNNLTGSIPEQLGNISTLRSLYLSRNRLSGDLPPKLGQLKELRTLNLNDNCFTGVLPTEFADLTEMRRLFLVGSCLSEPIQGIGNWAKLEILLLSNFEGPLLQEITKLENLSILWITDLVDKTMQGVPFPNISKLRQLELLILRNCSIIGQIPKDIVDMPNLTAIDLSFNNLTGEIPSRINELELDFIYLTGNNLTGSIPRFGANMTEISADFSDNNFTKVNFTYSKNMSRNINLYACCSPAATPKLDYEWEKNDFACADEPKNNYLYINCGGEQVWINGSVYEADLQDYGASTFYLSEKKNWAYSSTGTYFETDRNNLTYVLNRTCGINMVDAPLYTTARISPISLKYYGFCLINGNYSVNLHFAEIVLTEDKDYSSLGKRMFDVRIQGENVLTDFNIKEAAGGANNEVVKNFFAVVTNNSLEIHFYWAGKGFEAGFDYGPLISAISVTPVTRVQHSGRKLSAISIAGIAGIAGSGLLFIILFLLFLWKMGWIGKKDLHDEECEPVPGKERAFSLREIKDATENFKSSNELGKGGSGIVHKGVLRDKVQIAVKQLNSKSKQGLHEFLNEVRTIITLEHENLVRLLGYCTEKNQLMLVYEYMENNSLSSALFGPGNLKSELDWQTRYKICLGIAKGLAFLHEEIEMKKKMIIHRDIKPTNILLDKNLNVKISDFGLARDYRRENTHIITRIAGTVGYMAPEYAMRGHLTDKADVYSFGVVTLELISGKNSSETRPDDQTVFLLDKAYVLQKEGSLVELIDPELKEYNVKEATRVLDLAMLCTNFSPTLRPIMSEVVSILEGKTMMPVPPPSSSVDNFGTARAITELSLSSAYSAGSTSTEGTSNQPISSPGTTSKVEDELDAVHVHHEISGHENA